MKIDKINFTGKAYFFDNVNNAIKPEHKKRIEDYAKKLDEDTDVCVFGQKTQEYCFYEGQAYSKDKVSLDFSDDDINIKIQTPEGTKKAQIGEIAFKKILLPIYNACIYTNYNKENPYYMPYRKQFDFTKEAQNTLIRPNNKEEKDNIEY